MEFQSGAVSDGLFAERARREQTSYLPLTLIFGQENACVGMLGEMIHGPAECMYPIAPVNVNRRTMDICSLGSGREPRHRIWHHPFSATLILRTSFSGRNSKPFYRVSQTCVQDRTCCAGRRFLIASTSKNAILITQFHSHRHG